VLARENAKAWGRNDATLERNTKKRKRWNQKQSVGGKREEKKQDRQRLVRKGRAGGEEKAKIIDRTRNKLTSLRVRVNAGDKAQRVSGG